MRVEKGLRSYGIMGLSKNLLTRGLPWTRVGVETRHRMGGTRLRALSRGFLGSEKIGEYLG
jgi:hypothetical protein